MTDDKRPPRPAGRPAGLPQATQPQATQPQAPRPQAPRPQAPAPEPPQAPAALAPRGPSRLVDAIPDADEGDALFDQLFGEPSAEPPPAAPIDSLGGRSTGTPAVAEFSSALPTGSETTVFTRQASREVDEPTPFFERPVAPIEDRPSVEDLVDADDVELLDASFDAMQEGAAGAAVVAPSPEGKPSDELTWTAQTALPEPTPLMTPIDEEPLVDPPARERPPPEPTPLMADVRMADVRMSDVVFGDPSFESSAPESSAPESSPQDEPLSEPEQPTARPIADSDDSLPPSAPVHSPAPDESFPHDLAASPASPDASALLAAATEPRRAPRAMTPEPRSPADSIEIFLDESSEAGAVELSLSAAELAEAAVVSRRSADLSPAPFSASPAPEVSYEEPRPSQRSDIFGAEAVHEAESGAVDRAAWAARARWLRGEAPPKADPAGRAAALMVVAEIFAIAGEDAEAEQVAKEALQLQPQSALAHRLLRDLLVRRGAWDEVAEALAREARAADSPRAKAHAAYLGAEVLRIVQNDDAAAARLMDRAASADPTDLRAGLGRLCAGLAGGDAVPKADAALASVRAEIVAVRSGGADAAGAKSAYGRMLAARAGLHRRDPAEALRVLSDLGDEALDAAAAWLGAVIAMPHPQLRASAVGAIERAMQGSHRALAERLLVASALERGDREALSGLRSSTSLAPIDRLLITALAALQSPAVDLAALTAGGAEGDGPIAAAAAIAFEQPLDPSLWPGDARSRLLLALGRELGAVERDGPALACLSPLCAELAEIEPDNGLVRALSIEKAYSAGDAVELAAQLSSLAAPSEQRAGAPSRSEPEPGESGAARALAAALVLEKSGDREAMAAAAAPVAGENEAALRVALDGLTGQAALDAVGAFADRSTDDLLAGLLLAQAAQGAGAEADAIWRRAHERFDGWPIPAFFGLHGAIASGDAEAIAHWLGLGGHERAAECVLEAFVVAGADRCELLGQAHRAKPDDEALRDQYELAGGDRTGRATWLAERSSRSGQAALALEAALLHELDGDVGAASQCLARAPAAGAASGLSDSFALRYALEGQDPQAAIEALAAAFRRAEDPRERRDAAALIAQLVERSGSDAAAAVRWRNEATIADPGDTSSWLQAERLALESDDAAWLGAVELGLCRALSGVEAAAHAMLAARSLRRASGSDADYEAVLRAAAESPKNPWALRQLIGHARRRGDFAACWRACADLADQTGRPLDRATLLTRAAEGALSAADDAAAGTLLGDALAAYSAHPTAQRLRAGLLERVGQPAQAAVAFEELAALSKGRRTRAAQLYRAASLWLANDDERAAAEARRLLEEVTALDPEHAEAFERLQAIYLAAGAKLELAELLAQRVHGVTDPRHKGELEVLRGRMLAEAGATAEAKKALSASVEARPDDVEAWRAYADVCLADCDWPAAERALLSLGRMVTEPNARGAVYLLLGDLYADHLPNPQRAALAYREALKLDPSRLEAREKLVELHASSGDFPAAIAEAQALCAAAPDPATQCARSIGLAQVQERAGNAAEAEKILLGLRKSHPKEAAPVSALHGLYTRQGKADAAAQLIERTGAEVRRALAAGRLEEPLLALCVALAELRHQPDATRAAQAALLALQGQRSSLAGAGARAGQEGLDAELAPEVFTPAFRQLLGRTGHILEAAVPFDLRSLRAKPLTGPPELVDRARELARAYGLGEVALVSTSTLGRAVMPLLSPPTLCFGAGLIEADPPEAREFLIHRALKLIQTRSAAFTRTAPIDLWPLCAAYLKAHSPSFNPSGADAAKVEHYCQRMRAALPNVDPRLNLLASDVIGSIGTRASSLNASAGSWGSRTGLLAIGDPAAALEAIAWLTGGVAPSDPAERLRWIARQQEARDLIVFSVSDTYAALRGLLCVARPMQLSESEQTLEIAPMDLSTDDEGDTIEG